jgi:hypothetical protein
VSTIAFPFFSERTMIDSLMLRLAAYPQDGGTRPAAALPKFVYIETQGLLNPGRDWDNEIHPTPDGFEKLAVAFQNALVTQFPGLP